MLNVNLSPIDYGALFTKSLQDAYNTAMLPQTTAIANALKQSEVPLNYAKSQLDLTNSYYKPEEVAVALGNLAARQQQLGPANQARLQTNAYVDLMRNLTPTEREAVRAQNPAAWNALMANMGNAALKSSAQASDSQAPSLNVTPNPYANVYSNAIGQQLSSQNQNQSSQMPSQQYYDAIHGNNVPAEPRLPIPVTNQGQFNKFYNLQQAATGNNAIPVPANAPNVAAHDLPAGALWKNSPPVKANQPLPTPPVGDSLGGRTVSNSGTQPIANPTKTDAKDVTIDPQTGKVVTPNFDVTAADNEHLADISGALANQKLGGAKLNDRLNAARALSNFLSSPGINDSINYLIKYSGPTGRAQLIWDRIANPDQYVKYVNAENQLGSIISGSLKVLEGMPTTNESLERAVNYFKAAPGMWVHDPQAMLDYFNGARNLLNLESRSLNSASQTYTGKGFPVSDIPPFTLNKSINPDVSMTLNGTTLNIPRNQTGSALKTQSIPSGRVRVTVTGGGTGTIPKAQLKQYLQDNPNEKVVG